MNKLFNERLPRVFFHSGVLPSRDPGEIAAMEAASMLISPFWMAPSIAISRYSWRGIPLCEAYAGADNYPAPLPFTGLGFALNVTESPRRSPNSCIASKMRS